MFDTPFFASPGVLLQGAVVGLVFGFLLQKGGLTRFEVIVGQFLFRDFTVLKTLGTAIVVGGIGVYAMAALGWIDAFHVKAAQLAANALGGVIFGAGMAVLGYCPGTGVAALGQGSRHAASGVLGMLGGAALYAEAHPFVARHVLGAVDLGKATFATATGLSPWWFLGLLALAAGFGFAALERSERRRTAAAAETLAARPREAAVP
jgi:hypothetical protein